MLNSAQQDALNSFIAKEGIYFETIQDDKAFNLGTKVLYLERAISQSCQDFLQSLDKLYHPDLTGEAMTANLDFIRALKTINDLCFNHQVKYGDFGTRDALTHFFASLGGAIAPNDFKASVQTIITQQIAALREGHEEEADSQKTARETAETDMAKQTGWREKLDLPLAQLPEQVRRSQAIQLLPVELNLIQASNGALTADQYQQLSPEVRLVIANNADATGLILTCGATFATLQALTVRELSELCIKPFALVQLVNEVQVPLPTLLALDPAVRTELLDKSPSVVRLVKEGEIALADLLALDRAVRTELLENTAGVVGLMKEGLPLANLLALNQAVRTELFDKSSEVVSLVKEGQVSFKQLSDLSVPQLRTVIANPESEASQEILNPPSSSYRP